MNMLGMFDNGISGSFPHWKNISKTRLHYLSKISVCAVHRIAWSKPENLLELLSPKLRKLLDIAGFSWPWWTGLSNNSSQNQPKRLLGPKARHRNSTSIRANSKQWSAESIMETSPIPFLQKSCRLSSCQAWCTVELLGLPSLLNFWYPNSITSWPLPASWKGKVMPFSTNSLPVPRSAASSFLLGK